MRGLTHAEALILDEMLKRYEQRKRRQKPKPERSDRTYLLDVADGPECIRIFTSEEEGMVDWSEDIPALYVEVSLFDSYVKLGPFKLKTIREGVEKALRHA